MLYFEMHLTLNMIKIQTYITGKEITLQEFKTENLF